MPANLHRHRVGRRHNGCSPRGRVAVDDLALTHAAAPPATFERRRRRRGVVPPAGAPGLSAAAGSEPAGQGRGRTTWPPMISDLWYAEYFEIEQLDASGPRLGLAFLRAIYRRRLIVTTLTKWVFVSAIVSTLLGRRQLVILELQRTLVAGWRTQAIRLARPLVGRAIAGAQVLSSWEVEACHAFLGIPEERIHFIPWALPELEAAPGPRAGFVLASGRAACDWETLFRAAEGAEWPLTVVCGRLDADRVEALNAGGRATVLVDIPYEQHTELLRHASVYVLPLREEGHGAGHVRIMEAIATMTPVVTTSIRGLVDYTVPGETALVVSPGDAAALRLGVERLLADEAAGFQLAARARERYADRTQDDYRRRIEALVADAVQSRR